MKFVDEVRIHVKAGDGGDGAVAWRREKFIPRGGPADKGGGSDMNGRSAAPLELRVPPGTVVKDAATGEVIGDLATAGDRLVVAKGGKGGLGNMNFATSTNQAPRYAEPGTPGEERDLVLELKLLADVGIVGFPNAGKSTLISRISRARPKIADYPFTTLVPNLGLVQYRAERSFVMADIPGLIPGASAGAGLGLRFLRHVERCRVLIHLIDLFAQGEGREPIRDFDVLQEELRKHSPDLAQKPQIVAANKLDLTEARARGTKLAVAKNRKSLT